MFKILLLSLLALCCKSAEANSKIVVWEQNYANPFILESLKHIAAQTTQANDHYSIVPSEKMTANEAFKALQDGEIDVFIGGINHTREMTTKPIYVPLDQGLLGFRVCLVNTMSLFSSHFESSVKPIQAALKIGIPVGEIDAKVYKDNGFRIQQNSSFEQLVAMLQRDELDCISRSILDAKKDLASVQKNALEESSITVDTKLMFIYPNAQFIFINNNNKVLHNDLSIGLGRAIENNSYFALFEKHYNDILLANQIYKRKLIFMSNSNMSRRAYAAINQFGVASFNIPYNTQNELQDHGQ